MSDHAKDNAKNWLADIVASVNAIESAVEAGDDDKAEEIRERIQQEPLSVAVRSGWYSPGMDAPSPEEFEILLSTGGPALRITGDLGSYGEPDEPRLQWQDWGTPWTDYPADATESAALGEYARSFYFGG